MLRSPWHSRYSTSNFAPILQIYIVSCFFFLFFYFQFSKTDGFVCRKRQDKSNFWKLGTHGFSVVLCCLPVTSQDTLCAKPFCWLVSTVSTCEFDFYARTYTSHSQFGNRIIGRHKGRIQLSIDQLVLENWLRLIRQWHAVVRIAPA